MVTGLARACIDRGHTVQVVLPFYESLPDDRIGGLQHAQDFDCPKACRSLTTQLTVQKHMNIQLIASCKLREHASSYSAALYTQGRVWDGVFQTGVLRTQAFRGTIEGIPVVLLRPDWASCNLFRGSAIYGGNYNELEAYLYFSRHGRTIGLC